MPKTSKKKTIKAWAGTDEDGNLYWTHQDIPMIFGTKKGVLTNKFLTAENIRPVTITIH